MTTRTLQFDVKSSRMLGEAVGRYSPGAIEAPEINRYLVDVLEGTRPAFENRDSKYFSGA